jgi:hypothetical protein
MKASFSSFLVSFFLRSEPNAMPQKGKRIGESGGLSNTALMRGSVPALL